MKQPAFQFYPADWRKDPGIQSLSLNDRGAWFEMLCLMHESPRRGVLLLPSGEPMSDGQLARILGISKDKIATILLHLRVSGVASRDEISGALLCRRMVRDEKLSSVRRASGSLGGNPGLVKQTASKTKKSSNQNPTPSSSSSSSSSSSEEANTVNDSLNTVSPTAEKRAGRVIDEAADIFAAKCLELTGVPYRFTGHDWKFLADLRKSYGISGKTTPEGWEQAVMNYFGSSDLKKYTLADMANRYAVFKNSPTSSKGMINHVNGGNGNGQLKLTDGELNKRAIEDQMRRALAPKIR